MTKCWLMKSEPDVFSIDRLKKDRRTLWDGVRNYQARNFMMKDMKKGDQVLFYHSNAKPPGVVGLAEVVSPEAVPDPTCWNKASEYYDPKSSQDSPRWFCVRVGFKKKFKTPITLDEIKAHSQLKNMAVAQKGQRLSIQPVEKKHFQTILRLCN